MTRGRGLPLIAALTIVVGVGSAAAIDVVRSDGPPGFVPITYAPQVDPAGLADELQPGTPAEALSLLQRRLSSTAIVSARLTQLPKSDASPGGLTLVQTVQASESGPTGIRATWEAEILAGALKDVMSARHLGTLDNFQTDELLAGKDVGTVDSGFGNVLPGQIFDRSKASQLTAHITRLLRASDLAPVTVEVENGIQLAPVVVARTRNPRGLVDALTQPSAWTGILGNYDNYEGYYFELQDSSGAPVLVSTAAHRAGASSAWIRQDLAPPRLITSPVPVPGSG